MEWYHKGAAVWDKTPDHPVTQADIEVNDRIAQRLISARPTYGWLSEETRDDPENRDMSRIFVVDPIDGTKAFIKREPYFCISIARLEKDEPVVGVIYNPCTEEMFEAVKHGGARLNGKPITASSTNGVEGARMLGHANMFAHKDWPTPWPNMTISDPVPNALAYRLALVAAGKWDAAIALSHKCDWDLAAATLILEEAGGCCTDHLGRNYSFNGRTPVQRSVVASGALLHPLLIDRVHMVSIPDPRNYECMPGPSQMTDAPGANQRKAKPMSASAPEAQNQLLHIVIGGELKDVRGVEFQDISQIEFVGAFGSYKKAYDAWKSAAQRTVDNAEMRFFILHAHRLLDPETGHTHDV